MNINVVKAMYPAGTKVKLIKMDDPKPAAPGIYTVDFVDDAGDIHVKESGLAFIPGVDSFFKEEV